MTTTITHTQYKQFRAPDLLPPDFPEPNWINFTSYPIDAIVDASIYRARDGRQAYAVVRYVFDVKTEYKTYSVRDRQWALGGATGDMHYPLYRLPEDDKSSDILVVEGEQCADVAAALPQFEGWWVTCAFGGQYFRDGTNWAAVKDRNVVIAPKFSAKGDKFAQRVVNAAKRAGAKTVRKLDPVWLYKELGGSGQPPPDWSIASVPVPAPPVAPLSADSAAPAPPPPSDADAPAIAPPCPHCGAASARCILCRGTVPSSTLAVGSPSADWAMFNTGARIGHAHAACVLRNQREYEITDPVPAN